jgi:hypothetical protein
VHGDGRVALFILLEFEGDSNTVGEVEMWGRMWDELLILIEANGLECEEFGASFTVNFGVFTGTHGEEEGPNDELSNRDVEFGGGDGSDVAQNGGGNKSFLGLGAGIGIL